MSTNTRTRPPGPILWRSSLKNTIYDVLKAREGWQEVPDCGDAAAADGGGSGVASFSGGGNGGAGGAGSTNWDFFWADKGWIHNELDKVHLSDWQRINHFPNHYELTRKDLLLKNLKRTKRALEREGRAAEAAAYAFFPQTFVLPSEYRMLVEEFKRAGGGAAWIMKPIGRAQGQGIFLFNKLSQISDWRRDHTWKPDGGEEQAETYLAQRYLDNPYLVGGKKFDLRIYALVTSYNPLRVYLYRSGFARFTNARFSMRKEDIANTFVHLTNVAIQKHAPGFDRSKGMKWPIRSLRLFLATRHGSAPADALFGEVQALIIRALLAVQPAMIHDKHCFELYGYDILIDSALKPWLLEVNASPSLSASDKADWTLKFGMLNDMLDIIDLEGRREAGRVPQRQGGFDLIWDGGPAAALGDRPTSLPSLLGCYNLRDANQIRRQLRELEAEDAPCSGGSSGAGPGGRGGGGGGGRIGSGGAGGAGGTPGKGRPQSAGRATAAAPSGRALRADADAMR